MLWRAAAAPRQQGFAAGATLAAAALLAAAPAGASELGKDLRAAVEDIDAKLDALEGAYSAVAGVAGQAFAVASDVAEKAAPVAKRIAKAAAPVASEAASYAQRTVVPAASSAASEAVATVKSALASSGVDVAPVVDVAKSAASAGAEIAKEAVPVVTEAAQAAASVSPVLVLEYALVGGTALLVLQAALSALGGAVRGYAGSVRPVEALDQLTSGGGYVVDLRNGSEVASKGAIELPRGAARKLLAVPVEKLVGSSYRNSKNVESSLTALKISALKGLGTGSKVFLLDQNGRTSPEIAKALGARGFGNVYVIEGGFDKWVATGLKTRQVQAQGIGSMFRRVDAPEPAPARATTRRALPAGRR